MAKAAASLARPRCLLSECKTKWLACHIAGGSLHDSEQNGVLGANGEGVVRMQHAAATPATAAKSHLVFGSSSTITAMLRPSCHLRSCSVKSGGSNDMLGGSRR